MLFQLYFMKKKKLMQGPHWKNDNDNISCPGITRV